MEVGDNVTATAFIATHTLEILLKVSLVSLYMLYIPFLWLSIYFEKQVNRYMHPMIGWSK